MEKYNHKKIETDWKQKWEDWDLYKTQEEKDKPKYYILDMFPYPSGAGLHVGHPKGYIATDIFARMKTMKGFNVLHPMGWDAFGLPAENYAIKNKVHPRVSTEENIATFKRQLGKLGFSYDWDREINTTDPEFYKWTQWTFLKMFERGLAYESNEPINWCPSCKTGLANEDLEDGKCERCGSEIELKPMRQWVLKITDYADRMLDDLDKLPDWDDSIREQQRNWIGRSEGAHVEFKLKSEDKELESLKVFTTRPDTLFGCTYMVVAPEHSLIKNYELEITNYDAVKDYVEKAKNKTDLERTDLNKDKTGVELKGIKAINPVNGKEMPVFVADYVLIGYGTGAIMAVPAHDERDWEFAKKYNLEMIEVVKADNSDMRELQEEGHIAFSGMGINVNSEFLNGLYTTEAKTKMIAWLEEKGIGTKAVNYKLKDWVFSRQRYWGEPIPIIHCATCGAVAVPESDLPVKLPEVENYEPSGTGESPLATIPEWVNTTCPKCGEPAKRETNTMPQWAGSSWYYLRYIDPKNNEALVDKAREKYWSPVDFYVGGAEHATRHLIYARFWHKFLFDIGVVNYEEPFTRLQHVGLIMAEDGRKMSKRWGNVINPDDIVEEYGADAMRVYEMFMGPFSQACAWNTKGLIGARKFLDKIWGLQEKLEENYSDSKEVISLLHKTNQKVSEDIEEFKLNTAIAAMMILTNKLSEQEKISFDTFAMLLQILAPFAPFLSEELWSQLGNTESVFKSAWPEYNAELARDETIQLIVQVNGKLRDTLEVLADISEEEAKKLALKSEKIQKWIEGKEVVKVIFVKGKLVSIVVK
jgi:leucyl-tRNA synthetase